MIKITAKMLIREGCVEKFHEIARELVEKSAAEEGNILYTLNQSVSDPTVHTFIEFWKDQAAIDIHNASEHFTRIVPQFAELVTEPQPAELFTEVTW